MGRIWYDLICHIHIHGLVLCNINYCLAFIFRLECLRGPTVVSNIDEYKWVIVFDLGLLMCAGRIKNFQHDGSLTPSSGTASQSSTILYHSNAAVAMAIRQNSHCACWTSDSTSLTLELRTV